jgi:hypothetical protein
MSGNQDEEEIRIYNNKNQEDMHKLAVEDPDRSIKVESKDEKEYLQWLKDKERYSVKGLNSKLTGMRLYKKWRSEK